MLTCNSKKSPSHAQISPSWAVTQMQNCLIGLTPIRQTPKAQNNFPHDSWARKTARFVPGKATYNANRNPHKVFQTSNKNAVVYDISMVPDVPSNVAMVQVNTQIGRAIRGARMRYTNKIRTHLEVTFQSEEAAKIWAEKTITIANQECGGCYATKDKKSYFTVNLTNVPLDDPNEISNQLLLIFQGIGDISVIKPKYWEGTSILTDAWTITFNTSELPMTMSYLESSQESSISGVKKFSSTGN